MDYPIVYIVDDDIKIIESILQVTESIKLKTKAFENAQDFLDQYEPLQHGCLILDVRMPVMSGPELQIKLNERNSILPIIFMSKYVDVALAVRVMKLGAIDFLTKPIDDQNLIETINKALHIDRLNREKQRINSKIKAKLSFLSPRELQVLELMIDGKKNKVISSELNIALKTVEAHRASIFKKMNVSSFAELVKLVLMNWIHES